MVARAHDCITLLLGSKERYADYVDKYPGTYWYSPGWNKHHTPPGPDRYQKLLTEYTEKYGQDNAQYLMETEQHWFTTYDRATYVHLSIGATDSDKQYTRDCADWLKWNYDEQAGDPQLLIDMLAGHWDDDRFLVLEPGVTLEMSGDDRVIQAKPRLSTLHVHMSGADSVLPLENKGDSLLSLSELLRHHGMPLNTRCGERGICDGCMVELHEGALQHQDSGKRVEANHQPILLKACEHTIVDDSKESVSIHVPRRSTTAYKPSILDSCRINVPFAHQPICKVTAQHYLGLAVDIGTTTVAMQLVDLRDGQVLGRASAFNLQMHMGDDVLTRINLCSTDSGNIKVMQHKLVIETFEPLIAELLEKTGVCHQHIAVMTAAGNATMLHLLAGVDPSSMGFIPFTPQFLEHKQCDWQSVGLFWDDAWGESPALHLLPGASAYVGADLVAGLLASGLCYDDGPSLLVDVGTNGEIIFKHGDTLLGCATAAGPAFEGAGLKAGIRAGDGAVSHISITTDPIHFDMQVIGDVDPIGLCGSAYIDLLGRGRKSGVIDARGHFDIARFAELSKRICKDDGRSLSLHLGHDLYVSEAEIARILQAKAAIAAGILTLLDKAHIKASDIKRLYLAGGFGMHVDLQSAIDSGLLPGFTLDQIQLVGNTSLAGAYIGMMDRDLMAVMSAEAEKIDVLELNIEPAFEDHYLDELML
ncbi:MAG TPA: hypothetical protein DER01_03340 [Phycisphaerales bacterium]|nr:hypothetical protein [Phycisphaerales bacterium]